MQVLPSDTSVIFFPEDSLLTDSLSAAGDTIQASPDAYPSLFSSTAIREKLEEKPIPSVNQPVWVPAILVMCFILLAWGRLFFPKRLAMIFRAIFAKNYANQLIREGNIFIERIGLVLFIIYLTSISMFLYQSLPLFDININMSPLLTYLAILGFFWGFWLMKSFMVNSLSWLFNTREHSRDLLSNMYLFNLFAGMLLLPLVSIMAYTQRDVFFYIILILLALIYSFRIFREAVIGIRLIKFSVFHLILYLCTLEILPLIVLAKILSRNMIL